MEKDVPAHLSKFFSLLSEFKKSSAQTKEDSLDVFLIEVENTISAIIELLHFSLLSGEYYELDLANKQSIKDIEENLLRELESFLSIITDIPQDNPDNVKKTLLAGKNIKNLKENIESYFYFIRFLSDSLNEHSTNYIYTKLDLLLEEDKSVFEDVFKEIDGSWHPKNIESNEHHSFIFNISLHLSLFDEGYTCDIPTLISLINFNNKISLIKLINTSVVNLIKDKLQWLIYKLLYRLQKTEQIREYKIFDKITKKDIPYTIDKKDIESNIFYKQYKSDLDKCYPEKKRKIKDNLGLINKVIENVDLITIREIHQLCKSLKNDDSYIMDFDADLVHVFKSNLIKIKNQYHLKYNSSKYEFDKYAYQSAIGLLSNILFKIFCDELLMVVKKNENLDIINDGITSLKIRISLEDSLGSDLRNDRIQSSFQLIRICTKSVYSLIIELRRNLDNYEYVETNKKHLLSLIENIRELIEITTSRVIGIKLHIKSAKQGRWMPVYLSKEECKITNERIKELYGDIEGIYPDSILLDSSYILPSNYKVLEKLLSEDIDKLTVNDFIFRGVISVKILDTYDSRLKEEVDKVAGIKNDTELNIKSILKENSNEFNSKVKDSQMNAIQYLGLYAGIITFVLSSVSIVPKFDYSYSNILLFMFAFASCLCLFVFLLRFLFVDSVRTISLFGIKDIGAKNIFAFTLFLGLFGFSILGIYVNRKNNINTRFNNTTTTKTFLKDTCNNVCNDTSINIIETNASYFPKLDDSRAK